MTHQDAGAMRSQAPERTADDFDSADAACLTPAHRFDEILIGVLRAL
jgi:hypothetical protein